MWTGLVLPAGPLQGPVPEAGSSSQAWKYQSPVASIPIPAGLLLRSQGSVL